MPTSEPLRHPIRALLRRRDDVSDLRAQSRVSAYVYGDVLVLAATAGVSPAGIRSGQAVLVVLGTVLSTYVAHVLADVVGALFAGRASRAMLLAEVRDSLPVISAGLPAGVLLDAAAIGWLTPVVAQLAACAVLILRLAALGLVYRRLRPEVTLERALGFGVVVALVAAVAAVLKVWLVH